MFTDEVKEKVFTDEVKGGFEIKMLLFLKTKNWMEDRNMMTCTDFLFGTIKLW